MMKLNTQYKKGIKKGLKIAASMAIRKACLSCDQYTYMSYNVFAKEILEKIRTIFIPMEKK